MASRKFILPGVILYLQLLLPCESGLLSKFFNYAEDVLQSATNIVLGCDVPEGGCPNSNITYWLYTRDTQDLPHQLDPSKPETIFNAEFVAGAPLKVIIHGYTGYRDYSPNMELRPAYFAHGEYNIITMDWNPLALQPCYVQAVENVKLVAQCAAEFLDSLSQTRDEVDLKNTHIIGFSLGAHVAGLLGTNLMTGKAARVTGFDPALPLFDDLTNSEDEMLNTNAAEFVDVYHSNMGFKGKKSACGHVDVYFNNGANQPGCNCNSSCDHVRSVEYFAEAINSPTGLWGFLCDGWDSYIKGSCEVTSTYDLVELGEAITLRENAVYLAFTNNASLYLLDPSVYVEDKNLAEKVEWSCNLLEYVF